MFKVVKDLKLSLAELILLIYFTNEENPVFDPLLIKKVTFLNEEEIMEGFTNLTNKKLISLDVVKTDDGKISEKVELANLYKIIASDLTKDTKEEQTENIFDIFEKEFGRTLSPMEFEIINAWLKSGIKKELIIGALKEATYNGVSNLRYIDKIIYEWNKKGFKNIIDVNKHLIKKTPPTDNKDLFDYNWLEDE